MEELSKHFQKQLNKIEQLNEFILIMRKKEGYINELLEIKTKSIDVKQLLEQCVNFLNTFKKITHNKCRQLIAESQDQTMIMLKMIEHVNNMDQKQLQIIKYKDISEHLTSVNFTPLLDVRNNSHMNRASSIRMNLFEYEKSPYLNQIKPMALQFYDFDVEIKQEDYDDVPKYLKGRDTLFDIQSALGTISQCFSDKYALLHKNRDAIKNLRTLDLWKLFKSEASYFPGQKFISIGDLARLLNKSVDKKFTNRLTILRHLQILKEYRRKSTTFYVWNL